MSNKDLEKREQEIEKVEENEEEVVEGYCGTCKTATKKRCLTDCIACTPVFTCDK